VGHHDFVCCGKKVDQCYGPTQLFCEFYQNFDSKTHLFLFLCPRSHSTALAAAGTMFVPLTATLASAGTAMGCYGFGVGAYIVLLPTLLAKTLGVKRLPVTYSFTRLTMGFMSLVTPQVNGEAKKIRGFLANFLIYGKSAIVLVMSVRDVRP
jgi:hypothetical protein